MKDSVENEELVLDTSGTECPIPVLKARKLASELNKDTVIKIIATDPLAEADFEHYCDQSNYEYISCCLLYTSPSPRDKRQSRMPSSA